MKPIANLSEHPVGAFAAASERVMRQTMEGRVRSFWIER